MFFFLLLEDEELDSVFNRSSAEAFGSTTALTGSFAFGLGLALLVLPDLTRFLFYVVKSTSTTTS